MNSKSVVVAVPRKIRKTAAKFLVEHVMLQATVDYPARRKLLAAQALEIVRKRFGDAGNEAKKAS